MFTSLRLCSLRMALWVGYWGAHSSHGGALLGLWFAVMLIQGSFLLKEKDEGIRARFILVGLNNG